MLRSILAFGAIVTLAGHAAAITLYSQPLKPIATILDSQHDTSGKYGDLATAYDNFALAEKAVVTEVNFTGGYDGDPTTNEITGFTVRF